MDDEIQQEIQQDGDPIMNSLAVSALLAASRLLPRRTPLLGPLIHNPIVSAATGAMLAFTVVDLIRNGGDAARGGSSSAADGGRAGVPYEEWTRAELYELARERDVAGRSRMDKSELIEELRRQR